MEQIITHLSSQRKRLRELDHLEDSGRVSAMLDVAVISLYNRLTNLMEANNKEIRRHGAVVAIGEFGRRQLGPFSPVELLFLYTPAMPHEKEAWVSGIVQPLQQAEWKVTFEMATVGETVDRALSDYQWLNAIVDSRFISGARRLADELRVALNQEITADRERQAIRTFLEEWQEREAGQRDPGPVLEPDLEYSAGSLGELNRIHLAGYLFRATEDLTDAKVLDSTGAAVLEEAESFLLRVRNHLQVLRQSQETRLQYEAQQEVALSLDYRDQGDFLAVEVMMRDVESHFYEVRLIADRFKRLLKEWMTPESEVSTHMGAKEVAPGILVDRGRLQVSEQMLDGSSEALLEIFSQAVRLNLPLAVEAYQWAKRKSSELPEALKDKARLRDWLFEIVREEKPTASTVRALYETAVLPAIIPELRDVHALVQHDAFHLHPVHEHHLQTFAEIKKLLSGEYDSDYPEVLEWVDDCKDREVFLLAALIHDVGKGGGRGHAKRGGEMGPVIGDRLGLADEEKKLLSFLVANHVLLTDSAARRDLDDQQMLAYCTSVIGSVERLNMLMLHAFADMKTTGPRAWELYQSLPMIELYHCLLHRLEKGDPDEKRVAARLEFLRRQVVEILAEEMKPEEFDYQFEQLDSRYLLSVTAEEMSSHIRLERQLEKEGLSWQVQEKQENWELTLVSRHPLGLLARVAGILTLHQLDIRKAQTHTKKNGVALQIFEVAGMEPSVEITWEQVISDLKKTLEGKLALEYRLALQASKQKRKKRSAPEKSDEVVVDNHSSDRYTIIEVYATDRPGLLYGITRTLLELRLHVFVAKISTRVDQVADIFYVLTQEGKRAEDPEHVEEIKQALLYSLQQ